MAAQNLNKAEVSFSFLDLISQLISILGPTMVSISSLRPVSTQTKIIVSIHRI